MKSFTLSALTIMCLVSTPLLEAQTITGSVRDEATGAPLEAVQVFIAGTGAGILTQASGQYLLLNVPVGTHTVTAQLLGYREVSVVVTVAAGETVVQNLIMSVQADTVLCRGSSEARPSGGHLIDP